MAILGQELILVIRRQFALNWKGIHGARYWARVRVNGLRLAETTGANTVVVELFAFMHASRRVNAARDPVMLEWAYRRSIRA